MGEITFLGTSSCTPTKRRNVSCAAFKSDGGKVFLIDCGEGAQYRMRLSSLKWSQCAGIFITHLHGDHLYGLPGLMCTMGAALLAARTSALSNQGHQGDVDCMSGRVTVQSAEALAKATLPPLRVYGPPGLRLYVRMNLVLSVSGIGYPFEVVELHPPVPCPPVVLDGHPCCHVDSDASRTSMGEGEDARSGRDGGSLCIFPDQPASFGTQLAQYSVAVIGDAAMYLSRKLGGVMRSMSRGTQAVATKGTGWHHAPRGGAALDSADMNGVDNEASDPADKATPLTEGGPLDARPGAQNVVSPFALRGQSSSVVPRVPVDDVSDLDDPFAAHACEVGGEDLVPDSDGTWRLGVIDGVDVTARAINHRAMSLAYAFVELERKRLLDVAKLKTMGIKPGPVYGRLQRGETVEATCMDGSVVTVCGCDVMLPAPPRDKFVYVGDTSNSSNALPIAEGASVLVHEATHENALEEQCIRYGHSTPVRSWLLRSINGDTFVE